MKSSVDRPYSLHLHYLDLHQAMFDSPNGLPISDQAKPKGTDYDACRKIAEIRNLIIENKILVNSPCFGYNFKISFYLKKANRFEVKQYFLKYEKIGLKAKYFIQKEA